MRAQSKIILFGEHFVVYGSYGIAAAVDLFTEVNIEESSEAKIIFNGEDEGTENYKGFKQIIEHLNIENLNLNNSNENENENEKNKNFKLTFKTQAPITGGLGVSAGMCVAFVKELNEKYNLNLNNKQINTAALAGEKIFHGNASGIDNTVITYGGIILFRKTSGKIGYFNIDYNEKDNNNNNNIKNKIKLIICDTGKKRNTPELVEKVAKLKQKNELAFSDYINDINEITKEAKKTIEENNIKELGELFNENQLLLKEIGVSTPEIDNIIEVALENNALGAKLTGSGGGGCVIIIAKPEHENNIINKLKHLNYNCFSVYIG